MPQATYEGTVTVPLADLQPFPGNAKRGDVGTLLASLRRHGQYRSLVVQHVHPPAPEISTDSATHVDAPRRRLVVLAGNHTAQALNLHGAGDCGQPVQDDTGTRPCGVCGNNPAWELTARCELVICDEDTARRINLVDNRSSDLGSYDADALAELLSFLDNDYAGSGYQEADVTRLLAPPPSMEELVDSYRDPEDEDMWPVLRFTVPPEVRDHFYDLTADCLTPGDDTARFQHLLDRVAPTPLGDAV
ncbi:hypothetical protein ACGFR8_07910 [Streptomyces brevispora]|uniref:hypothetical protein n=1 Tax=Streptomyces brevispora TaxID=887462 RepID=UPI00371F790A